MRKNSEVRENDLAKTRRREKRRRVRKESEKGMQGYDHRQRR